MHAFLSNVAIARNQLFFCLLQRRLVSSWFQVWAAEEEEKMRDTIFEENDSKTKHVYYIYVKTSTIQQLIRSTIDF
jgi:hypothetical protein